LDTFDARALAVMAHVSAVFGDQAELQWWLIHAPVSEYGQGVRALNHYLDAAEKAAGPAPAKTYVRLARFIETCRAHGVRTFLVPMPQPEVWELDPSISQTIAAGGAELIDARAIDGMTADDFSDGYHLSETGGEKFSRFLGEELAARLRW
jgi:hypothetical protein